MTETAETLRRIAATGIVPEALVWRLGERTAGAALLRLGKSGDTLSTAARLHEDASALAAVFGATLPPLFDPPESPERAVITAAVYLASTVPEAVTPSVALLGERAVRLLQLALELPMVQTLHDTPAHPAAVARTRDALEASEVPPELAALVESVIRTAGEEAGDHLMLSTYEEGFALLNRRSG